MTETFRTQIDQLLDGDLPDAEQAALLSAIEHDTEAIAYLADRAILHTSLGVLAFSHSDRLVNLARENITTSRLDEPCRRGSRIIKPVVLTASTLLIGLFGISLFLLPRASASPAQVVEKALVAYNSTVDRRYAVEIALGMPSLRNPARRRLPAAHSTLWVRGNRFVQQYDSWGHAPAWGRDAMGAVWFSLSQETATVFEADEIPEVLQEACDLRTLDLHTLLQSLLKDFDLQSISRIANVESIRGLPLSSHATSKYGSVELEIDRDSLLVRKIKLERVHRGRIVAIVTYSLHETTTGKDSLYEWQSYIVDDAQVFRRGSRRAGRTELLRHFLQFLREPTQAPQSTSAPMMRTSRESF